MADATLNIRIDQELLEEIKEMGKAEKRSMSAQALLCIEVGLAEIRRREKKLRELDLSSGQAQETAAAMGEARA